jgi:NitT/TauT family transport system permease protein
VARKIALIAELFGAETGLGYVMLQAQTISDVATVLATCLMIVFLFILGDSLLLRPIARRFAP